MPVEIAPSMLAADASRFGEQCRAVEAAGAHRVHWDVMDGVFVPNLTFGPDVVAACRPLVELRFEAHLMVVKPDELAPLYIEAGCDTVLIHAETCPHLHRSLAAISEAGARCGVVLNPHTPASSISEVMNLIDEVLVMTVNPGFGGQRYIASVESKIAQVRRMIDASQRSIDLEVDGGISTATAAGAVTAGANVLVAGSAVFGHSEGPAAAVEELLAASGV
ncbi:MAG: ribulose-phosphate 3-epimerase [Acidimicrobiaceae bacterium]|nr:ribulose-phosphate 3-epimerase [Acidimicrobiaceae bacterium]